LGDSGEYPEGCREEARLFFRQLKVDLTSAAYGDIIKGELEIILKYGVQIMAKAVEILRRAHAEGTLDIPYLARSLGILPEEVRELISSLQDQGYLEAVECLNSANPCHRCPLKACCHKDSPGIKLYRLSGRGRRLIGKGEGC